jgi:hypothetical protein
MKPCPSKGGATYGTGRGVGVPDRRWRDERSREDPGAPRRSWSFAFDRGEDGDQFKRDELAASDSLLLGRVTYEHFAEAWPGQSDEYG